MDQQFITYSLPVCIAMVPVSLGLIVFHVREMVKHEIPTKRTISLLRQVSTPFNICLMLMAVSQTVIYTTESVILFVGTRQPVLAATLAVRSWGILLFKLPYLYYSYLRTYPIAEQEFPQVIYPMRGIAVTAAITSMFPTLTSTISIWISYDLLVTINSDFSMASYVLIFTVDVIFLFAFGRILHKVNMEKADVHFVIISRYGIAAAILFFILTGFAICYSSIDNELYFILISFTLTAIYLTLGAMKVALRKDKDRETAEKKGKRDTAVRMSEGKSTTLWTQTAVAVENDKADDLIRRVS